MTTTEKMRTLIDPKGLEQAYDSATHVKPRLDEIRAEVSKAEPCETAQQAIDLAFLCIIRSAKTRIPNRGAVKSAAAYLVVAMGLIDDGAVNDDCTVGS
jgi:hypothetical protein